MTKSPTERDQEQKYLVDISMKFSDIGRRMVQLIKEPKIDYQELLETKAFLESVQAVITSADTKAFEDLVDGLNKGIFALGSVLEEDFDTEEELKEYLDAVLRGAMECKIAVGEILKDYISEGDLFRELREDEAEEAAKQKELEHELAIEQAKKTQQEKALQESLERIRKRDEEFSKNMPKGKKKKETPSKKPISEEEMFAKQMGMKMSTTKQIDSLVTLADKFDSAGEHEKANQIDELLQKMAIELDLPEYRPEKDPGTPSWISKDKWDKMKEVHELGDMFKKFVDDPTMEKHNSLIEGIAKFMKHTKEEGVIASQQVEIEKTSQSSVSDVFEKLAGIADKLDSVGATEEASLIDEFIEKQAKGKEKDKEPYDTKQHHSEQVREPKKPGKETKDRDGRKEHHVETYKDTGAAALSTRYCPEHVGVMLGRIGENTYQCALDGQVYNWETGWTDYDGKKHPGGSVAGQTPSATEYAIPHRIFDSREKA